MIVSRKFDLTVVAIIALAVAGYAAFQPRLHLRTKMPEEFFDGGSLPTAKRGAEHKLAEAYWKCAVSQVQWKYGYGYRLPQEPPPEFDLLGNDANLSGNDAASRARYWQKLRQVWNLPSVWRKEYGFELTSTKRSMQAAADWLEYQMWRLTGLR